LAVVDGSIIADQSKVVNMNPCCPSVLAEPLAEDQAEDLAAAFAALSDPVRLRLLSLVADAGELCSCNLEEPLGKSQPTISHHTKVLAEAGLIRGEKRGRWVWWQIVPERLDAVRNSLAVKVPS
jgi:ArsR family transcriptional regulator, arsenate/arsenite/antimonite-responsive transcriptional repressor